MQTRAIALFVAAAVGGLACGGSSIHDSSDAGQDRASDDASAEDSSTVDGGVDSIAPDDAAAVDGHTDGGSIPPRGGCVGCTFTALGAPTWEPTSIVLFSGRIGQFGEDYNLFLQSILAPRHQFYSVVNEFGPAVAHQPPYEGEIYDLLAARGIRPSQIFTDQDFTAPNGVIMTMTVVPTAGAAVASSFDFASGPVITNLQFPIVVDADLYRNGQLYDPAFDTFYMGYSQFAPPVAVSGSNPPVPAQGMSHLFMNFGENNSFGPPPIPTVAADGDYEYRVTMSDAMGGGWKVVVPFKVGRGAGPASSGIVLAPDANGAFDGSNPAGVVGGWWSTGDYFGADGLPGGGSCPLAGFPTSACSMLAPAPGMTFQPDPNGKGMCTSGIAAQVIAGGDGQPAWSSIWGNITAFDLAFAGPPDAGASGVRPYDTAAHGITGFAFDIDAVPPGGHVRVEFATTGTETNAAYWGGATTDLSPVRAAGHYEMRWPEIGGPLYLGASAPPFDATKLQSIRFHVVSDISTSVPYSFCISNTMLLTN